MISCANDAISFIHRVFGFKGGEGRGREGTGGKGREEEIMLPLSGLQGRGGKTKIIHFKILNQTRKNL